MQLWSAERVWPSTCHCERANAGFLARALCASSVAAVPRLYACISERESVHVWDVTQTKAAQHSRLFKEPFILLQLVQLLKTDKQDLELRAAKNRPPTPLLKPLWPGPTLHCDWEKKNLKKSTNKHKKYTRKFIHQLNDQWCKKKTIKSPSRAKHLHLFKIFYLFRHCEDIGHLGYLYWISTKFCSQFHNKTP